MPISKHRKKTNRVKRINNPGTITTVQADMQAPAMLKFSSGDIAPHDFLAEKNIQAESAVVQLEECINDIEKYTKKFDPIITLSTLSFYGLFGGLKDDGQVNSFHPDIQQNHVELLQAFYLKLPIGETGLEIPLGHDISGIIAMLKALTEAYDAQLQKNITPAVGPEERHEQLLLLYLRMHTHTVRNWSFFNNTIDIVSRLFGEIDAEFETATGIEASRLVEVFEYILRRSERLGNERFMLLRKIFKKSTIEKFIYGYYAQFPELTDSPAELVAYFKGHKASIADVKAFTLSHLDLSLANLFTFDTQELARAFDLDPVKLDVVLARLSMQFGELQDTEVSYLFLGNPVWQTPLIKTSEGAFFCPIPVLFSGYIIRILENLIAHNKALTRKYQQKIRAEFLENEILQLFSKAFPGCEIKAGYKWDEYETDLLVRVDSNLFIVEAKSHKANPAALRGGKDSAKKHIQEVFLHPSQQSLRLEQRIKHALANPKEIQTLLPNFPLALEKIQSVYRLSVTLEELATMQANLHMAQDVGWIPVDHPIAPCMIVSDLAIVFDMLELSALKIHYLKRRMECQTNTKLLGDELDHLGHYMKSGLRFFRNGEESAMIIEMEMSRFIDAYYIAKDAKNAAKKPRIRLHPYWIRICKRMEERSFEGWSSVAMALLSFTYELQEGMYSAFQAIKLNVKNRWKEPNHNCSVIAIQDNEQPEALVFHAYNNQNKHKRHDVMKELAQHALQTEYVQTVVVVSVNIDNDDGPYSSLRVFLRGKDSCDQNAND